MKTEKLETPINREVLHWARVQSGLSLEEVARRAHIGTIQPSVKKQGLTPAQRLEQWESGDAVPSFAQLEKIANVYRRPLFTFFFPSPPKEETRIKDFRTVGNISVFDSTAHPDFAALIRRTEALQQQVREICLAEEDNPLPFVGSATIEDGVHEIANNIRETIGFHFTEQRQEKDKERLFNRLRTQIEHAGVFVVVQGNLANYHTNIPPDVFRGLAISDEIAPLILINANDYKAAKLFTLIHEIAHIWLGNTSLSNLYSLSLDYKAQRKEEIFCNKVAAEFLVPEVEILTIWQQHKEDSPQLLIETLSTKCKVSEICAARRLIEFNLIPENVYQAFYKKYLGRVKILKEKQAQSDSGPPPRTMVPYRLGKKLISRVLEAAQTGLITELDASRMLNVKINKFADIYP